VVLPTLVLLVLPTADACEADWVLALALAPELLDEAPLPIGLPITFTLGLDIEVDCDPDELIAVELDPEFDVELWAWAAPLSSANAVAASSMCLIDVFLRKRREADFPPPATYELAYCRFNNASISDDGSAGS
jgi:hypothetical protein